MRTSEVIRFRCSGCQQLYHVSPTLANERAKCRRCGHVFEIPASSAEALNGRRPGQALVDRLTACRIAGTGERLSRNRFSTRLIAVGSCALLLPAIVVAAAMLRADSSPVFRENLQRGRVARFSPPRSKFDFASVTELIEAIEPSVVCIKTNTGISSGFVIDESGLIVTCYHCIDDARGGRVIFKDQSEAPIVGVRRVAPERDLAVIQIETTRSLVPLPISTEPPKKGEPVIAFGSPAGLSFTVTEGSVSAVRTGEEMSKLSDQFSHSIDGAPWQQFTPTVSLVQITASTMPGNSGGPIVDFRGNVLGVSAFGLNWRGQMLGFCISAQDILEVASQLDAQLTPLRDRSAPVPKIILQPEIPWKHFPPFQVAPPGPLATQ
jgi:S1-C subfamily serine protease